MRLFIAAGAGARGIAAYAPVMELYWARAVQAPTNVCFSICKISLSRITARKRPDILHRGANFDGLKPHGRLDSASRFGGRWKRDRLEFDSGGAETIIVFTLSTWAQDS